MNSDIVKLLQLAELAKDVGMEKEERFISTFRRLSARWNERIYQKTWDMLMNRDLRPLMDTTFPVPFKAEDLEAVTEGQYKIGTITDTDIEFGLSPLQLNYHAVIGGQTGFGKSTFIKVLSRQILREGRTLIWLIDPKEGGGDFRFLARELAPDSNNLGFVVLRPDTLRCNPFTPIPNVPVNMLRETLSEVTADSFGVYDASEGMIAKHVQRALDAYENPSLFDFVASLRQERGRPGGRMQGYLDSLNTRLTKAQISLGEIIDCREDYFSRLYDRSVVFEVGELSGSAQRVLVPWVIMKLVLYKIKNPTSYLSHLLVFDEAQSELWSRQLEMRGRTSYMATLATRCRSYGLGIIVLAQNPAGKLMTEIIANSCIKLCFHLGSGFEVDGMARNMGLDYEQKEAMHHLKRGEAICRVGLGYTEPMRLDIHNFQDEPVGDDELAELMKPHWDRLLDGIEPARPERRKEDYPRPVERTGALSKEKVSGALPVKSGSLSEGDAVSSVRPETLPDLSSDELTYLRIVSSHPWRLVTEVYNLLNNEKVMGTACIGKNKAVKIRQKLIKKKYLESFTVLGTGKSGRSRCDVPTGKAGLGKASKPRGGYLHGFWCYRVSEFFRRKGAEVKIGDTLSGSEVDVAVDLDGKRIGVEVVVSGLVVDNLTGHLSVSDEMLILCVDEKKKNEMMRLIADLSDDIRERIKIELLKDYFISL